MTLVHLYPATAFDETVSELNRAFNKIFAGAGGPEAQNPDYTWAPRVDVSENENEIVLVMEVPGISKKDFHIVLEDSSLVIEGERRRPELKDGEEQPIRSERWYGKFYRRFKIGKGVKTDGITASYENGELKVVLPKVEKVKPKAITIK